MKLTKTFVDKAKPPEDKDQVFYRDEQLKGFALRVTAKGVKSFVIETTIGNRVRRMTIGRYGKLTVEQARREAKKMLGKIATGVDIVSERQAARVKSITLQEAFNDYLKARSSLKATTIFDYQRAMREAFPDWQNKALIHITKDMVSKRHLQLGKKSKARANLSMRVLRAVLNFAIAQYEDHQGRPLLPDNPVNRLSQSRAWYRVEKRQSFIKPHEMAPWYSAVQSLNNDVLRDYLLLLIFTGLRRREAATLRWEQVDLKSKTLIITETKNRESHTLPLSTFLCSLLKQRKEAAINDYVFPGSGTSGFIIEPRKQMEKVAAISGIPFTLHDLRRTFITTGESIDISAYALKRLANHKMNHDVTSGYIISDVERLRKPMQQITDYLMRCMGMIQSTPIEFKQPERMMP